MARIPSRVFDATRPVYVRRFFVANGRHYEPGDLFDWTRMAVAQRRVAQLFDAGKLMHTGDAPAAPMSSVADTTPAPVQTDEPTIQQEVEDEDILATAAPAADGLDDLNMKELRDIAEAEGAPFRVSREAQREAIREHRRGQDQ
jgi:hypothetical protein